MRSKKDRRLIWAIIRYFYMVVILFTLWVSATYTWFSISRTPRVSDLHMSIGSITGLELAFEYSTEDEGWTQFLDFGEVMSDIAPLKPVTWVDSMNRFYAATYAADGRMSGINKELSDEKNANQDNYDGYYMITSFYARSDAAIEVSLSEAVTNANGTQGSGTYVIGMPIWDSERVVHNNGGAGAQYSIRVGIKITKLDENGNDKADSVQFYVYEPNYDSHVDGSTGVYETPSVDGKATLVDEEYMIRQTTSTWTEFYPVTRDVIVQKLGEFTTDTYLFDLDANEYARIDLYFWMEGQDIDCNHMVGDSAEILASFQFYAEQKGQSGLEEFK